MTATSDPDDTTPGTAGAAVRQRRPTVFDALGGEDAVAAAVDALYDRLLIDPVTAPYFDGIEMRRLARHLRIFLVAALGGPAVYQGRDVGAAHASLGITGEAWDRTVHHLVDALASLQVGAPLIDDVIAHLAPLQPMIVTR